jgi:hypothetical protein
MENKLVKTFEASPPLLVRDETATFGLIVFFETS